MSDEGFEPPHSREDQNNPMYWYIYIYFKIFRDPCQISSVLPNGKNLIPKCVLKKITLTLTIFVITPMRLQDLEAHLRAEISWKLYALHFNFKKI